VMWSGSSPARSTGMGRADTAMTHIAIQEELDGRLSTGWNRSATNNTGVTNEPKQIKRRATGILPCPGMARWPWHKATKELESMYNAKALLRCQRDFAQLAARHRAARSKSARCSDRNSVLRHLALRSPSVRTSGASSCHCLPIVPGHEIVGGSPRSARHYQVQAGALAAVGCPGRLGPHLSPVPKLGLRISCPNLTLTFNSPDKHSEGDYGWLLR